MQYHWVLSKVLEGNEYVAPTDKSIPDDIDSSNEDKLGIGSTEMETEYIEDIIIGWNERKLKQHEVLFVIFRAGRRWLR